MLTWNPVLYAAGSFEIFNTPAFPVMFHPVALIKKLDTTGNSKDPLDSIKSIAVPELVVLVVAVVVLLNVVVVV